MNSMERVVTAMQNKEPDHVPVYPILSGVTRKLTGATYKDWATKADVCADAFLAAIEKYKLDTVVTLIDLSVECDAWGQELIFHEEDAAHPDYSKQVISDIEDYSKIKYVDYKTSERMMMHIEVIKRIAAKVKGQLPIAAFVFGPLGTLSMLRNQADMYLDVYDDPDALKEASHEVALTLKDYAEALIDAGADAIMWDTLFASGTIMGRDMWLDLEGDDMRMLSAAVREKGGMNMVHNCGQRFYCSAQLETMQPVATSFLYPADDCADFAELKEKYGKKTLLVGAVTPANAVFGTDEEWERQCKDQIDIFAKDGGFMLATGCEYPSGADFHRAEMMLEIARTYGKYNK